MEYGEGQESANQGDTHNKAEPPDSKVGLWIFGGLVAELAGLPGDTL